MFIRNSRFSGKDGFARTALYTRFAENRRAAPYSSVSISQHPSPSLVSFALCMFSNPSSLLPFSPLFSLHEGIPVDTDTAGARSTRQRVLNGVQKWRRGAGEILREMKQKRGKSALPNLDPPGSRVYTFPPLSICPGGDFPSLLLLNLRDKKRTPHRMYRT